ncbi:probable translation initiation factor eIF-2B subunit delta isoform X1 [Chenopodium quinoa]|uniref:probable translation initiation factor eIF-2B subunit delta isoform X1 n=1 Tax=Chenopodium quinoa TaxID=63459 RepID=UPI000B76C866|nr:probable translation initiation factor eIF-2B subunit delta isoform X1 [Chenopodium quinoa]
MEPRRNPQNRARIDPKIRQVGFTFNPTTPTLNPNSSATVSADDSALSPVMIPPPPIPSDTSAASAASAAAASTSLPVPVPAHSAATAAATVSAAHRVYDDSHSYLAASSPESSQPDFSDDWVRSSSGKYSLGFDMSGVNSPVADQQSAHDADLTVIHHEKGGNISEVQVSHHEDKKVTSKPLKDKTSKAERRALQEAQRAAKSTKKAAASGVAPPVTEKPTKASKQYPQKKDVPLATSSVSVPEMKGGDRPSEKDKKKDVYHPRMQYDDKSRVEKAKKRSVIDKPEARNRVELFQHLPQYERGNQLRDLESKIFNLDSVHPAVYKVGLQYLSGDVSGSNARCIAMLYAFKEAIEDYHTPVDKILTRDLATRISSYVSFLNECRPLSISMGNAIRYVKARIAKLPSNLTETDTKATLSSDIYRFINEKIVIADKVIVQQAVTKVRDGDVLLTYGCSSVVEMVLVYAHELGKKFRVVIVDSRPKFEGQRLLRRLIAKGLSCTYTHINAVSYVMHEVTKVFLGAASILSNGIVYSRIGTACVSMVAHSFRVPVLICCEAYKFHERVLLDSICTNELGDPDVIAKVSGRKDLNYLDDWVNKKNLQLLNLLYDATPSDYISLIVTDYGMIPPTSVPVIVREYGKEHLF